MSSLLLTLSLVNQFAGGYHALHSAGRDPPCSACPPRQLACRYSAWVHRRVACRTFSGHNRVLNALAISQHTEGFQVIDGILYSKYFWTVGFSHIKNDWCYQF